MPKNAPLPDRGIFKLNIPVLGICYGLQILGHFLGGKVEPGLKREYGKGTLQVKDSFSPLFANLPESLQVWNSHADRLTKLPKGFKPVARTRELRLCRDREPNGQNVSACRFIRRSLTRRRAPEILANFVHKICGCGKNWTDAPLHRPGGGSEFARTWATSA